MAGPADEVWSQVEPLLERAGGYAYALTGNRADAEDAVQETLVKLCRAGNGYDRSRPFAAWFFAVLRNCCRDLLRRRRARPVVQLERAGDPPAPSLPAAAEELTAALAKLTEPHREILQLRYYGGLAYREIAVVLDIPEGTVMSRLHAARQALAAQYGKEE